MDEIIGRIIDIENKACAVIEQAEKEKENIDETIKAQIAKLKSQIDKRADDKCAYIKTLEDDDAQKQLEQTQKITEAAKHKLEEIYNQKHSEWVESITSEIISL